jgi:hypothetical protein
MEKPEPEPSTSDWLTPDPRVLRVVVEEAVVQRESLHGIELHATRLTRASYVYPSLTSLDESIMRTDSIREVSTSVRFYIHGREGRPSLGLDDLDWFHMHRD